MTLQTDQLKQRLIQCPSDRVGGLPVGACEAKHLVVQICGHGTGFVEVDVRRYADL
jgi:hypothetical protein